MRANEIREKKLRVRSFTIICLALLLLFACDQKQGLPPADIKPSSTVSPFSVQPSQAIPTSTPSGVGSPSTPTALSTTNPCPITTKVSLNLSVLLSLFTSYPEECREKFVDFQYLFQLTSPESRPFYSGQGYQRDINKCTLPPEIKEDGEYSIRVVAHLKDGQSIEGNTVTVTIKKASTEDCRKTGGGASLEPP